MTLCLIHPNYFVRSRATDVTNILYLHWNSTPLFKRIVETVDFSDVAILNSEILSLMLFSGPIFSDMSILLGWIKIV